jgi:hypothetical protein
MQMAYGSLGGLGGRTSSYPMRVGTPTSQEVGYQQSWADWEADYLRRVASQGSAGADGGSFAGEDIQATRPVVVSPFDPSRPLAPTPENINSFGTIATRPTYQETGQGSASWGGPLVWPDDPNRPAAPTPDLTIGASTFRPHDFKQERLDAIERWAPQIRQQQAYDSMRGWGQENAVMGPGYQQAAFGQITGDPTGGMGASPMSGVNGTQSGVYSPSGGTAGVYGAPNRNTWGL